MVPLDEQQNAVLLVVADGMGGHAAGELASKAAVAAVEAAGGSVTVTG